jgi:hypothetical protein
VSGAVRPGFEVLSGDTVVATGVVGGESVELAAGEYRVRTSSGRVVGPVTVHADQQTTANVDG